MAYADDADFVAFFEVSVEDNIGVWVCWISPNTCFQRSPAKQRPFCNEIDYFVYAINDILRR